MNRYGDFEMPTELSTLIASGIWPLDNDSEFAQHRSPLVSGLEIAELVPEERKMFFYKPPFLTLQERIDLGDEHEFGTDGLNQIDPSRLLVLGDFGMGSDAYWGLYYQSSEDKNPVLMRERWTEQEGYCGWVKFCTNFKRFCELSGLSE